MKPGYEWSGRYLVWDLDAFQNANLFATTKKCMGNPNSPHGIQRIRLPVEGISFPLKSAHLKANDTLEGRTAKGVPAADDLGAADAPPPLPPPGQAPLSEPLGDALASRDREDAIAEGNEDDEEAENDRDREVASEEPPAAGPDGPKPASEFDEDDFSMAAVHARRREANDTASHVLAEYDTNHYDIRDADVIYALQQWGVHQE